jgi:hypothetical protein
MAGLASSSARLGIQTRPRETFREPANPVRPSDESRPLGRTTRSTSARCRSNLEQVEQILAFGRCPTPLKRLPESLFGQLALPETFQDLIAVDSDASLHTLFLLFSHLVQCLEYETNSLSVPHLTLERQADFKDGSRPRPVALRPLYFSPAISAVVSWAGSTPSSARRTWRQRAYCSSAVVRSPLSASARIAWRCASSRHGSISNCRAAYAYACSASPWRIRHSASRLSAPLRPFLLHQNPLLERRAVRDQEPFEEIAAIRCQGVLHPSQAGTAPVLAPMGVAVASEKQRAKRRKVQREVARAVELDGRSIA